MHARRILCAAATLVLAVSATGCSGGGSKESAKLDVYLNMTSGSAVYSEMKTLVEEFQKESNTQVNLTTDSSDTYEKNMKVRMASSNMPDVISTHGWSVLRYSPYLTTLNDQPWVQYMNKNLDTAMKDKDGNIYALPIEYTVTGISVNKDVLAQAGVDPSSITTWDDFSSALAKVKNVGKVPIAIGGKGSSAGNIADFIASGAFTEDQLKTFSGGTFDSQAWQSQVLDRVHAWAQAGYMSPDYVSATLDDMAKALAQGDAAFAFGQPTLLATSLKLNPQANVAFIPLPTDTGSQYLVGGEGVNAYGVSKTSAHKTEGLNFLKFLAEPDHARALAQAIGSYSGLTNATPDLGTLQPSYDAWVTPGKLPTQPFFDRVYLPNGIWATIISSTDSVITGQADPSAATQAMAAQFKSLSTQKSASAG